MLLCVAALVCAGAISGCGKRPADLVLYSSVDDYLLQDVVAAFELESGLKVVVLGDTEATKTTGLMQRLLAEKDAPRADVWWSSEPFASVRLAQEGVLEAYTSESAEANFDGAWPEHLRASDGTWYGFGLRARVICYNADMIDPDDVPDNFADLAGMQYKEKVIIADPRFGTTRGHMAAIAATDGPDALAAWLIGLRANEVQVYPSNSAVASAVLRFERPIGITDTDDIWVYRRDGYFIDFKYEQPEPGSAFGPGLHGPLVMPNTIGLVKGGPHPDAARRFIDFILSKEVARMIAASDSHNVSIYPDVAAEFPEYAIPNPWIPDYEAAAEAMDEAMAICKRTLERQ